MRHSYFIGVASIFYPSLIQIDTIDMPQESDSKNMADDWKQIGSYISTAYEFHRS
ncbi:MAG: hypothetical protein K2H47_11755 [Muribaculaceae bacterium]|nr:hypothetical protein [Muribaculaceae bacterium]